MMKIIVACLLTACYSEMMMVTSWMPVGAMVYASPGKCAYPQDQWASYSQTGR